MKSVGVDVVKLLSNLNFILYTAGRFMQRCELIVSGRERLVKN